jgi:hypothetical protein
VAEHSFGAVEEGEDDPAASGTGRLDVQREARLGHHPPETEGVLLDDVGDPLALHMLGTDFEEADGGTRVVLRHHDLPDDEQVDHHCKGWDMYLARLGVRAAGGDPGPDPTHSRPG